MRVKVCARPPSMLDGMPESTAGTSGDAPIDGIAIGTLSAPTAESTRTNAVVVMVSLGVILRPLSGEGAYILPLLFAPIHICKPFLHHNTFLRHGTHHAIIGT